MTTNEHIEESLRQGFSQNPHPVIMQSADQIYSVLGATRDEFFAQAKGRTVTLSSDEPPSVAFIAKTTEVRDPE